MRETKGLSLISELHSDLQHVPLPAPGMGWGAVSATQAVSSERSGQQTRVRLVALPVGRQPLQWAWRSTFPLEMSNFCHQSATNSPMW